MKLSKCFWNRYNFAWPFWRSHAVAGPADYRCVQCQRAHVSRYPNLNSTFTCLWIPHCWNERRDNYSWLNYEQR